jgi:hypothetical protein
MQNYTTKYRINYGNSFGDSFECFIKIRGNYTGDVIPLEGYCDLRYKAITNPFEPIRGASLQIKINVTIDNPLEELSIITEFEYFAEFYRNNEHLFSGWINPDGVFQDWVTDAWKPSLTAVDGLGFLKNYEFETNGLKPQEFNYLYAILRRLNYAIPIATFDDINLNFNSQGVPTNRDFANADRRVVSEGVFKNRNERNLDCETVLKDILLKYNFTIQQATVNGNLVWMVSRLPLLNATGNRKGQVWGFTTITNGQPNWSVLNTFESVQATIKTHSEPIEADAFHVNQNQQISFTPALQNFRFEMRWKGLINQWLGTLQDRFILTGSLTTFTPEGWISTIRNAPGASFIAAATSINNLFVDVQNPVNLIIEIKGILKLFMSLSLVQRTSRYRIRIGFQELNGDFLYLKLIDKNRTEWVDSVQSARVFEITADNSEPEYAEEFFTSIETPPVTRGTLQFILEKPSISSGLGGAAAQAITKSVEVFYSEPLLGLGEYHDATRVNFASSFLQEPQKVINSNHNEGFFINNLYRRSGINLLPQNQWKSSSSPTYQDLLELTARERVNLLQRPQMIFRGDIFGYIPYWCLINYTTIDGNFVARDYRYNTKDNVITLECHQIFQGIVNQNYEKSYIFDDERNVLIKS